MATVASVAQLDISIVDPHVVAIAPGRWRVLDRAGRVRGLVEARTEAAGTRYWALRFHAASRAFLGIGAFWNADEALECLRLSR